MLGDGAVLTGIVLAAAAVFVIEKKLKTAAMFLSAGAVFTFFGLMHSPELGFGQSPALALAYVLTAVIVLLAEPLTNPAAEASPVSEHSPSHTAASPRSS